MKFLVLKVLEGKDHEYTAGACKTKNNKPSNIKACIKFNGPCNIHAC